MRTIYTITTDSEDQVRYYEADESLVDSMDRYASDCPADRLAARQRLCLRQREPTSELDRLTQAIWGGSLAQAESLQGHVAREDFKAILRGTLPGSVQRIRGVRPNLNDKERLADDVVLSAPKSVSMALHLEKDMRLFDANLEAVQETLSVIEQELAQTRIQVDGVRQVVNTGKLLAVLMPHHSSRDGDMQLHTHLLIMNGTKAADGIWRSLYHEPLSKAEWIGSFYRQRLAEKVLALGYRIYPTQHGFELQGYSRNEIEVFSKRNQAIVEAVKKTGLPVNAETKQQQVLPTRKSKTRSGKKLEEIQSLWRAEARSKSVGKPVLDHPIFIEPKVETACHAVNRAIQDLSDELVSFSRDDIRASAMKQIQTEGISFKHINQAMREHQSLLDAGNGRYTTAQALEQETQIRQRWMAGQGKAIPLCSNPDLQQTKLNSGQAEAIYRALTSTDKHQIIPRLSPLGTSQVLGELSQQLAGSAINIRGFCANRDGARKLQKLGIQTSSIEHLVASQPKPLKNQLWIIQAGMINAQQLLDIQRQADAVAARLLLVGEKMHGSHMPVGSPLRSLIFHGATTHNIKQLIRQQNLMPRQALKLLVDGKVGTAMELLAANGHIKQIVDAKERAATIANQYLALPPNERNQTLIKTASQEECFSITQAIRTGLRAEGVLGNSIRTVQLVPRQFTDDPALQISNYQPGDYLRLHRDYRSTPLQKGQLYKIEQHKGGELVVSSYGGRLFRFNPRCYKDKTVYQAQEIEIAVGDRVHWTSTDKSQGQIKGETFMVASIQATTLRVIDQKEQVRDISLLQPLAVEHGWVSPLNQAQRKIAKRVIISATSDLSSAQALFHVSRSCQVRDIDVYTETLQDLHQSVQEVSKAIPLDLIGENSGNYRSQKRLGANLESGEVSRTQLNSDYPLTETQDYDEQMKGGEPKQRQFCAVKKQVISQEQEKLNRQALESSKRLLRKFGSVQPSGELTCTLGSYAFCADQKSLCVSCNQRGSILQVQGGQLTGSVTRKDLQGFESLEKALNQNILAQSMELD